MGISTDAKLLVGVSWKEIEPFLESKAVYEDEDLVEILEGLGLDSASPWCDSDREDWYVGYSIKCNKPVNEVWPSIYHYHIKFKELTGLEGRLIVSPDVT